MIYRGAQLHPYVMVADVIPVNLAKKDKYMSDRPETEIDQANNFG